MLMLLKYHLKYRRPVMLRYLVSIMLVPMLLVNVAAQEFSEALQVHGFIAQGAIDVDGSNYGDRQPNQKVELKGSSNRCSEHNQGNVDA